MTRLVLAGGDVVLPDRVAERHALVISGGIIEAVVAHPPAAETVIDVTDCLVVPGFVDTHVHGALGHDVQDGDGAVDRVGRALPRFGVTSWCPTSIACAPSVLDAFLHEVDALRSTGSTAGARVIGAHLESSFLNPVYRGAQPAEWLRTAVDAGEILDVIARHHAAIAVITLAPEIAAGFDLVARFVREGLRVSIGHSAATFDEARRAFALGASRVTHLFNRLAPMSHREPGAAGAALAADDIFVELIGDGVHVHPALLRIVHAAIGARRVVAITDGTAGSGLPPGARVSLGGRSVAVGDVARLADGTMAGSVTSMDKVFRRWVEEVGVGPVEAAIVCAATPAESVGRPDLGRLVPGTPADVVVLDRAFDVRRTFLNGVPAF
jgi:N-acetylglucosamine-6-phosphate deacetylase